MESILRQAEQRASVQDLSLKRMPQKSTNIDEELEALVNKQKAKIKVVGAGGAGNYYRRTLFGLYSRKRFELSGRACAEPSRRVDE